MTEREFDLATRAENQDMELRRDAGGCYWLDSSYDPSFRSVGPLDLDEIEDRIEAAEGGISRDQFEETQETQALVDYQETGVCCLCGKRYEHWGNNPYPLCDEDDRSSRCCNTCNWTKVIPARLQKREGTA